MVSVSKKNFLVKTILVGVSIATVLVGYNVLSNPAYSCVIPTPSKCVRPTPSKCVRPTPSKCVRPTPSKCPKTPIVCPSPEVYPSPVPSVCPPKSPAKPKYSPSNSQKKYIQPFLNKKKILSGIEKTGRVAIYGINFDFDRADIRPDSEPTLDEIAAVLKQNPELKIYIVGHADIVGDYQYNIKLSKERAQAVVDALISRYGIASDRLSAYGLGQVAPISTNDTDEGRSKNRRVELVKCNG